MRQGPLLYPIGRMALYYYSMSALLYKPGNMDAQVAQDALMITLISLPATLRSTYHLCELCIGNHAIALCLKAPY